MQGARVRKAHFGTLFAEERASSMSPISKKRLTNLKQYNYGKDYWN